MKKQFRLLLVGLVASQTVGCASLELLAVGGVSYLVTGKGIGDHALSMTMNEDCAFHRVLFDEPVCSPEVLTNQSSDMLLAEESARPMAESTPVAAEDTLIPQQDKGFSVDTDTLPSSIASIDSLVDGDLPSVTKLNKPQVYAVVGSFNDLKYAFERSSLYRIYNTQIIEAPKDSGIRYRVVIGPLQDKGLIAHIPQKSDIDKNPHWAVELCEDSLLPPPCDGQLLVKK